MYFNLKLIIVYIHIADASKKKRLSSVTCGRNKIYRQEVNDGFFYSKGFPDKYPPNCRQSWEMHCPAEKQSQ